MTVMTAPAPAAVSSSTPALFRQLEAELNHVFFERRDAIQAVLITVLAKQHGFILGPPGTAKSALLETVCKAFVGAKYWRILLDRQMGKEESFGQIDQAEFLRSGHWGRDVTDTFADCHVALLDEVGNTGPSVLNAYLTAMNERRFKPNGGWIDLPLISAFGASNFLLEDGMHAMWDRFATRFSVDEIVEDGAFLALLELAAGQRADAQVTTKIPLAALQRAVDIEVPAVTVPTGVLDSMRQLRSDLRAEQIVPSGRRWAVSVRLLKASAYFNGRAAVDDDDLAVLRYVLWEQPEQVSLVERKVLGMTSPITRLAMEIASDLDEITSEIDARKGQAVETRASYGGTAQHTVNVLADRLAKAIEDAQTSGRNTARLQEVREQIRQTRIKIFVECMNAPRDRAELMVPA